MIYLKIKQNCCTSGSFLMIVVLCNAPLRSFVGPLRYLVIPQNVADSADTK